VMLRPPALQLLNFLGSGHWTIGWGNHPAIGQDTLLYGEALLVDAFGNTENISLNASR